jgi:hypothetical protein
MTDPQNFANHSKRHPLFHFIVLPIMVANLVVTIVWAVRWSTFHNIWLVVISLAAVLLTLMVRMYSAKVQDRVIRLEERLRLQSLVPQEWHAQIYKLN